MRWNQDSPDLPRREWDGCTGGGCIGCACLWGGPGPLGRRDCSRGSTPQVADRPRRSGARSDRRRQPAQGRHQTRLMKTVHALRDVPLPDLTVEDIRVLLSQREGVDVLTPVALDILGSIPSPKATSTQATF
ncbi:contact-dependent growth inhibition system immunity protein [Nocardia rhamnosiphila]|uniref:contact-dependent growth inhibition system immunity protein n=1 Tax=Nocardia rhamnosiphila TaxID=426716 RepID=UPI0033E5E946